MIDDEIKDALNVEPSPEFVARVRTRIASEPEPSAWRWPWTVAAIGAMAAALLIAVVVSRPAPRPDAVQASGPEVVQALRPALERAAPNPAATPRASELAASKPAATRRVSVASGSIRTASAAVEPEILLDPAETRALRALIAGVRDGRVDLSGAQRSTTPVAMDLAPVADIVIVPITIDPIAPFSGAEGARP
jgi:hypothetical protein